MDVLFEAVEDRGDEHPLTIHQVLAKDDRLAVILGIDLAVVEVGIERLLERDPLLVGPAGHQVTVK